MPLKKGTSHEVVQQNIKEMVSAGHEPKQAVAAAMAMKRKSHMMAMGGMIDPDDDEGLGTNNSEDAQRSLAEIQIQGNSKSQDVANPEMQEDSDHLAKALYDQAQKMEMLSFSEGGLVENEDGENGTEPSMEMAAEVAEPMSAMPEKPAPLEYQLMGGLSEEARLAIQEKKKKRRFH